MASELSEIKRNANSTVVRYLKLPNLYKNKSATLFIALVTFCPCWQLIRIVFYSTTFHDGQPWWMQQFGHAALLLVDVYSLSI